MPQHILRDYSAALRHLQELILTMAAHSRQNLENAVKSLLNNDIDLAHSVIAADNDVDELERNVDQMGMETMIRFHPVAADLRLIIASMKIGTNLERISDHAVGIAKRARKLNKLSQVTEAQWLEPLYSLAYGLLRDAMDSYTNHDPELGESLHQKDREIDRLHKQLTRAFSAKIEEHAGSSEAWLHLIFASRSLERIGDLSVNIGEETVFLESAKDIRHEHRKPTAEPPAEPSPPTS
ncbi:MAG: phosphate signaling complex protein PhoU [Akkermansiaceae bacterium]|nr:phosphate signaling complex protein PhoU [Akkermansiaceae bacterium]